MRRNVTASNSPKSIRPSRRPGRHAEISQMGLAMDLPVKNSETNEPKLVALHGVVIVPHNSSVGGTPVGGLSGIDRDPQSGRYVTISDDQSQQAPARFYEAEIDLDDDGLQDVLF